MISSPPSFSTAEGRCGRNARVVRVCVEEKEGGEGVREWDGGGWR